MSRMKFALAAIAALVGVGGAYATRVKIPEHAALHTWLDKNGNPFIIATTAQAEQECPGDAVFCLNAQDHPTLIVYKAQ
ncbi:hypothetical protein SAMN05518672_106180 [Chitinophaga sp. CF118]|uniref:hypothetical protein n=1 Tax=Chitinophaga sp. CF118 TaxID=1884367 RepID=UPI0008F1DB0C|nr:hypothetical protein [Chitinophaga sp. CF118]SFE45438.1 hypothetical protein SAMN05518672_106180 [Chitinophaga sp. CF118]